MTTFLLPVDGHELYVLTDALVALPANDDLHGDTPDKLLARIRAVEPLVHAEAIEFVRHLVDRGRPQG